MRRFFVLAVALVALLGVLAPPASAQMPATAGAKVTITGLIDNVGTFARNFSSYDGNLNRNNDQQMYGRTRGRFDIEGTVGKARGVLGLEIDSYWGQTGFGDSNAQGCVTAQSGAVTCGATGSGAESSFDLNTDTQGNIQVKWLFTEFEMPFIPMNTVVRVGAQPFDTVASYKLALYANGDYPGLWFRTDIAPGARFQFAYVAVEENLTGKKDFLPFANTTSATAATAGRCTTAGNVTALAATACQPQARGDDWAIIASFEFSPFKGLDVKPMYSYFEAIGVTSGSARQGRGGISIAPGGSFAPIGIPAAAGLGNGVGGQDGAGTGVTESRHTIGVDARFTSGPFKLEPTFYYQWGGRDAWIAPIGGAAAGTTSSPYGAVGSKRTADISAWLVDVRATYSMGPLSLRGLVMWTSGDTAENNPYRHITYFQPLDTDTSYQNGWGNQILGLGIDYYQILNGAAANAGLNPGTAIGYDKYGRLQFAAQADYAVTPALTGHIGWTSMWTDKSVDTDGYLVANAGLQPNFFCRKTGQNCRVGGDHDYLGTELNTGFTYKMAAGLTFDWAFGYLFAGEALSHRLLGAQYNNTAGVPTPKDVGVNDVILTTARVRYQF